MKKIIVALCILIMITSSCMIGFAKGIDTPWDNPEIKIHVFEDFSSYGNKEVDQFTEGFVLESSAMTHFMRIKNEQLDFYAGGSGNMYFNYTLPAAAASKSQFANATGFAFYVENNTPGDIILGLQCKNSDGIQYICTAEAYCYDLELEELYLADTDDTWDVHCMPIVPALFKGYIIFPMSSVSKRVDGVWSDWDKNDYMDSIGLIVRGGVLNDDENMMIDNLFIFGDVSDNNNGRVYLDGIPSATPTPIITEKPTENPETNNSATESTAPEVSNPPQSNNSNLIWVYIAMGVVVVIGVVAIVLVLGKKKQ